MSLRLERLITSGYKQNCYVAADAGGDALIVDPGQDADSVAAILAGKGWRPLAVIATHAHFDHVGAVADLIDRYSIPFYLHRADAPMLRRMNLFKMLVEPGPALRVPEITHDLADMLDIFTIGDFAVEVVMTPGHTPGGVCFIIDGNIFTGDTILPKGVGRTDLPGGDPAQLAQSVDRLGRLPRGLEAHPGHGMSMPLGTLLDKAIKAESHGV